MKFLAFFAVPAVFCAGQVCSPSPDMKTAINEISAAGDRDAVITRYRNQLPEHPSDAKYLYYLAAALTGVKTPEAIRYFDQALEDNPTLLIVHPRLVTIYASPNFKDSAKLRSHLEAYLKACPDTDLSLYTRLERVDAPELVRDSAAALRKILAASENPADLFYYRVLWALEFKVQPPSEYEAVRERVRADLQRLSKFDLAQNRRLAPTLREGYKLLGDKDGIKAVDDQVPAAPESSAAAVMSALQDFNKVHPYPQGKAPREAFDERNQALLEATAEWVKKWPDEPMAWTQRYFALNSKYVGTPDPVFDEVGDAQLRIAAKSSYPADLKITVASMYMVHKMHPDLVEPLLKDALADLDKQKSTPPSDLYPVSSSTNSLANVLATRSRALEYLGDCYQRENRWDLFEQTLAQLHSALDRQKSTGFAQSFQEDSWKAVNNRYWQKMSTLDEHKGNNEDALSDLQKALAPEFQSRLSQFATESITVRARRLWTSLGKSQDDFPAWLEKYVPQKKEISPAASNGQSAPIEANRTLPPFTIADTSGRQWTLASLKGKTTLVNLWATWCEPCRKELPLLQKLYDRVKDRKDIVVLTFNTDDNPGLIDPFLKENHYTFPTLPAHDYVDSIVPSLAIPRNWIVNKQGVLASVTVGFNPNAGDTWVDKTLQLLENPNTDSFLDRTLASLDPGFSTRPDPKPGEPRPVESASAPELDRPHVMLNGPLPAFKLTDLAGKTWTETDLHGTVTLINVWATWCGPCRSELPLVQELYERTKDRSDIRVLTFNIDENQKAVQPFLNKYHYDFPVLDARPYAHSVLARVSIPRTWVVDKKGIVKDSSTGYSSSLARGWVDRTLKSLEKLQRGRD